MSSFQFVHSGNEYFIHPLDLSTITKPLEIDGKQYVACTSSFMAADNWAGDAYEVSLGDAFLRNVYTMYVPLGLIPTALLTALHLQLRFWRHWHGWQH